MKAHGKRTLRSKLLEIIVTTMIATGATMLAAVGWMGYTTEQQRLLDIERQIRETISSKAVTLALSHALALKGLVADNAFSDVRELVAGAVSHDHDVVYGLFVGENGSPWAYVSPTHPDAQSVEISEDALVALGIGPQALTATRLAQRRVRAFGQEIHECAAPVMDDDGERLGTIVYGFSNQRTHEAVAAARRRSDSALMKAFVSCGLVGLLSLLVGILWVRRSAARITAPVASLTAVANEIATGKRGIRVDITSGDEVEVLAASFNHMLEANEDAIQKLEVTTRRALAADRLKGEFLANMSHEIRTPMNGVVGMIQLIRAMQLEGKLKRYVDTIDASANALLTVINDILDFSKMEAGKYTIQAVAFEPRIVVQEVAELFANRAQDKGIELIYRVDPAFPSLVLGDADRFRQILNNLVSNAVKFTERGEVFLEVNLDSSASDHLVARVQVHDTGIGIDEKDLPRLYEAFSQADGTTVRRWGGTGLGLAICKRLVNMMGGEIGVETQLGRGSVFTFTLRLGLVETTEASPRAAAPASPGHRVLIVDANRRWRDVIEEHVRTWQMSGETAEHGAEALEHLKRAQEQQAAFDIAVISSDLCDMPATELVRAIRAEPAFERLPLILVTGLPDVSAPTGIESELVTQLHKPIRFSELYNCLTGTLSAGRQRAATPKSRVKSWISAHERRVLVVDDNEINRFVVMEELEQCGFRTDYAIDGRDAVRKFQSGEYLCVLMDCQMPVMDGYEATRSIRKFEARHGRRRTPVIALTAHALTGERERVLEAGMDDFLSKPFRPSSLEKLLTLHIKDKLAGSEPASASSLDPEAKRSDKLIGLFLEKMPAQLEDLGKAVERGSAADVRALAHKIKGSCLALAAPSMNKIAEGMQSRAEAGEIATAGVLLADLRREYDVVAAALRKELGRRPTSAPSPPLY